MVSAFEDPAQLAARLKLGREEFCQRLLTTLIVGGRYPRWNSRSAPTTEGRRFLEALDALSFGAATPPPADVFVDELELLPVLADERGGAPDWAVLWDHRTWIIELKTEAGSHRPSQLPGYYTLCGAHFPGTAVDITYLTGPLEKPAPVLDAGQRYSHVTWDEVLPLVEQTWGCGALSERRYVDVLHEIAADLGRRWTEQRTMLAARTTWSAAQAPRAPSAPSAPPPEGPRATTTRGMVADNVWEAIEGTARDGVQRALDPAGGSLEGLLAERESAMTAITSAPAASAERHVRPWVWRATSGGSAITTGGAEVGYELRFSRYTRPV